MESRANVMTAPCTLAAVLAFSAAITASQDDGPGLAELTAAPQVHEGDGWAIAAPGDWTLFREARPPALFYLIGDGHKNMPSSDGCLSPLKIGLVVERFPSQGESLRDRVARETKERKESSRFKLDGDSETSEITLADGTAAFSVATEFVRLENGRHSVQRKVYCADAEDRHIIATGFITVSRPGRSFVRGISLDGFLEAHVRSLVLDASKLDLDGLKPAYEGLDRRAEAALAKTRAGNNLLSTQDYSGATKEFREALKLCDQIPAAHNGLAWSLLSGEPPKPEDLAEALREAQTAVEQTAESDVASLDTLALAYDRTGDDDKAVAAVQTALKLQPNHPDLRRRLESLNK